MRKVLPWLGATTILVVIFGTIYATVQQAQRHEANSPQIQIAEDTAAALDDGQSPGLLTSDKKDFSRSLAPFVIIYSKAGHEVASSGRLGADSIPPAPLGVLAASQGKPYYAVTWQPRPDVRVAAVTVTAKHYYVLSGRSLTEVEKNENRTFQIALLGGVIAFGLLVVVFVTNELIRQQKL